ncbi:O-antigen ligase family protein [Patescibacteria group bacterium]|nr:O-antigen ligase family protein [Patescibacteria group bacterium]
MDLLKKLFILLLIVAFPLGEIARFSFNNGISFTANDVVVFVIFLYWGYKVFFGRKKIKGNLRQAFLIFLVLAFSSLLLNVVRYPANQVLIAFLYLVRWAIYSSIYFSVVALSKETKGYIKKLMYISGLLVALIGYVQFFFYSNLRNLYYLGWDDHLYRLFSSFLDPNFAGIILVLAFILTFSMFYESLSKEGIGKLLFGISSLLVFISIFLTYSRSAIVALVVSVFIFLSLTKMKKLILVFVLLIFAMLIFSPDAFIRENTNFFRTASSNARLESINYSIEIFKSSPIYGIGFNAYRYSLYQNGFISGKLWETSHGGSAPDNSFLFVLATTGVVGFAGYLYLLYSMFKKVPEKINIKKMEIMPAVFIASLAGVLVSSFFINSFFYSFILTWIWLLAAVTENS